MKCFLPCFSASKTRKTHFSQSPNNPISIQPTHHNNVLQESILWISESKIQNEDQSQFINNTNLDPKEKATKEEKTITQCKSESKGNQKEEEECSESLFSVSIGCGKPVSVSADENADTEVNSTPPMRLHRVKDSSGSPLIVPLKEPKSENQQNETKDLEGKSKEEEIEKVKVRTLNHFLEYRYKDCSDDGYNDINIDDDSPYNEKTGGEDEEEECSESLFSISTDSNKRKRNSFSSSENEVVFDNEVSSVIVAEESEGNNVLNPIENITQGNVKMVKEICTIKKDKENINWVQAMNLSSSSISKRKMNVTEIGVDASLSDWLVESEKNRTPKKRGNDNKGRTILGELRVTTTTASRRSFSADDTINIASTVGSYWTHTEHSKSNRYTKDKKQEWSSPAIKTKLEPEFEASVAQN